MDFELQEFDRIEKIKQINESKNLLENGYLSLSGGKDSLVVHYMLDIALPNNQIPRLFINTGIDYADIRKFVFDLANKDSRIIIINSGVNIPKMLREKGYPFKSKEHSLKVNEYKKGSRAPNILKYKDGTGKYTCPKILKYQYQDDFILHISNRCCYELKKNIAHKWVKENHLSITITGMRNEEGGQRESLNCLTDKGSKFHPLAPVNEDFIDWFITKHNIELCKLYYPPYNFERTGCKGCPFNLKLQEDLDTMLIYLPQERIQCEIIWKEVYKEYRRIGYRLRKELNLFERSLFENVKGLEVSE